ncbi:cysteine hydrolase family protein [Paraliomyxa miuraensis]|uniref:cysteine hydrolase family protein n=1 Tax=Paraliomyxa miuraensis TaxID=376150 RepID=UPI0022536FBD|nr:isochorismatase family protein [Paraliomyxa miuraensis]MCX4240234.1 isochorismatase family protein [Paraliomyxa miuraensis]
MPRILIDVDTQHDFVSPQGALHVPADPSVPEAIASLLRQAETAGDPILGSVDSHAHDAWEFADNGGPFPPHCVKGTPGWLRVFHDRPTRTRFIPMQVATSGVANLVGERHRGAGPRVLDAAALAAEARAGIGLYFEKEVYSLFSNPTAEAVLAELCASLGGPQAVTFDVIGYCTGGYCVDAAALGLRERGYRVRVIAAATAAIGGEEGQARSRESLRDAGVEWVANR